MTVSTLFCSTTMDIAALTDPFTVEGMFQLAAITHLVGSLPFCRTAAMVFWPMTAPGIHTRPHEVRLRLFLPCSRRHPWEARKQAR